MCLGWNNCWTRPVFRENLHNESANRQFCLILSGMCEVPRFKIVLPSFIDLRLASLSEREFAGKNISNPGPNMVMRS